MEKQHQSNTEEDWIILDQHLGTASPKGIMPGSTAGGSWRVYIYIIYLYCIMIYYGVYMCIYIHAYYIYL